MSAGPYESDPGPEVRAAAAAGFDGDTIAAANARWHEAVDGIPLGAFDKRIVEWAENAMDQGTLWVFAGLLDRARQSSAAVKE